MFFPPPLGERRAILRSIPPTTARFAAAVKATTPDDGNVAEKQARPGEKNASLDAWRPSLGASSSSAASLIEA